MTAKSKLQVWQEPQPDKTVLWRVCRGRTPVGGELTPPRPADGGGFKTQREALALMEHMKCRKGE